MTLSEIAKYRLTSQQIAETKFKSIQDLVGWMGAIQAQDFPMSKWAVGVRLPGSTEQMIENAIDNAGIIRTHLLRPTWHLVSADDIYWMLELTAPQIKTQLKSRHKFLGLNERLISKSNKVIEKTLLKGINVTREEIVAQLEKAGFKNDDNRASHLLLVAELDGLICSGKTKNHRHTYALLNERVPRREKISREEALAKLALKYFSSHCPASLADFVWWSGLSVKDAKYALESVRTNFVQEKIVSTIYWFANNLTSPKKENDSFHLLPAYDEFIVSYKDRSAVLTMENLKKTITKNGLFYPTVVKNGQAIGIWKQITEKDKVLIEVEALQSKDKIPKNKIENSVTEFEFFLGKQVELVYKN